VAVGLLGAENVGVHVVTDDVADPNVPVTGNEYSLLAQLPSVFPVTVKEFLGGGQVPASVEIGFPPTNVAVIVEGASPNTIAVILIAVFEISEVISQFKTNGVFSTAEPIAELVQAYVGETGVSKVIVVAIFALTSSSDCPVILNVYFVFDAHAPSSIELNLIPVQFVNVIIIKREKNWIFII
jgi:hypothetical protein